MTRPTRPIRALRSLAAPSSFVVILLAALALRTDAHGHGLHVDALLGDGEIVVEVKYESGAPAAGLEARLFAAGDEPAPGAPALATAVLDAGGRARLDLSAVTAGDLVIVVSDGAGHRASVSIAEESVRDTSAASGAPTPLASTTDDLLLGAWPLWARLLLGAGVILTLGVAVRLARVRRGERS